MWTATIKSRQIDSGVIKVYVDFTNGTDVVTEWCKPSDVGGLYHWVRDRISVFNESITLEQDLVVGNDITGIVEQEEPVLTPEEIAQNTWFNDYRKMQEVGKLIDLGIFTGDEAPILTLKNKLKNNFEVAYIDLM